MTNVYLKEKFVARAKALSKEPKLVRSELVTALIAESVGFGVPAEAEYFKAAYGDPTGRDYWDSYLSEPMRVGAFAYLLSAHLPVKAERLETAKVAITLALQAAAMAGERLFVGDVGALLAFDYSRDFGGLMVVRVRPRAAVEWLLSKPKREDMVPGSLRAFVDKEYAAQPKQRRITRKSADEVVAQYISDEKAAGRRPTLAGLEAAVKQMGFYGGRKHLRVAFHRSPDVIVREGRPRKLAN